MYSPHLRPNLDRIKFIDYVKIVGETPSLIPNSEVFGDIEQELEENIDEIILCYASFVQCITLKIEERGVSTSQLRNYLMKLSPFFRDDKQKRVLLSDLEKELKAAKDIDEIFTLISTKYTSFLNYDIFKAIIKEYNIDDEDEELKYEKHLKNYINKHKISEFVSINPLLKAVDDADKVVLKIDIENTRSITHIVDIKKHVAKILGLKKSAVRIYDVKEGCVMVTLLIPTGIAEVIFNKDTKFTPENVKKFQDMSILWLECKGYHYEFISRDKPQSGKINDCTFIMA